MPFIPAADGTALHYNDWGSGHPVVMIHGWPLSGAMWEYQAMFLAANGCRVIAYDRRGFGESGKPWTGYDYDTFASDLAAILDRLDLNGVTLVGFSMGGGEVARYLGAHGSRRVARAVLVGAVTPMLAKTADHPDGAPASVFEEMIAGLLDDRPSFLAAFGKKFFGAGLLNFSVSSAVLDWSQRLALQASPKATVDCVRAFGGTDFRRDMAAFTLPTLIIHGDADDIVPPAITARAAARMVPGAKLVEYPGAPHGLFFTERLRLNADLLNFITTT